MSTHRAELRWERADGEPFVDGRYSRRHYIRFDGGAILHGSASPHVVREPFSDPTAVDPEEAFVAALAACHMLWFLSFAASDGWVVDDYIDEAEGRLGRDADGLLAMTAVTLRPRVGFAGPEPSIEQVQALHVRAHGECFLARSVKCPVRCEPRI